MNQVVKGILGLVAVGGSLLGAFAVYVSLQPGTLAVQQSVVVKASPEDVRAYARDLKLWNQWSPWADIDPNVVSVFSDPSAGVDAWYTWEGNDEVGQGKMTVMIDEPSKVVHEIAFKKPMEGVATATLTWTGAEKETTVTWGFEQRADFGTKAANLFLDIEAMLEKDFAKGMTRLKPLVEKAAAHREAELLRIEAAVEARAEANRLLTPADQ